VGGSHNGDNAVLTECESVDRNALPGATTNDKQEQARAMIFEDRTITIRDNASVRIQLIQ
jgi:hypothetical protein